MLLRVGISPTVISLGGATDGGISNSVRVSVSMHAPIPSLQRELARGDPFVRRHGSNLRSPGITSKHLVKQPYVQTVANPCLSRPGRPGEL